MRHGKLSGNRKFLNRLMLLAIMLCLVAAIWDNRDCIKWILSAIYMSAIRYTFFKPYSAVIGGELELE